MTTPIAFDDRVARALERMYQTPDVVGQRSRLLQALALRPGEHVLDVGVGPGLLAGDMAATVGEKGHVAGVDQSEAMVAMARTRCEAWPWTDFQLADATALPFEDGRFHAATATQVYEYVADMDAALAELARVLAPGGRAMILDTDWDSLVWYTGTAAACAACSRRGTSTSTTRTCPPPWTAACATRASTWSAAR